MLLIINTIRIFLASLTYWRCHRDWFTDFTFTYEEPTARKQLPVCNIITLFLREILTFRITDEIDTVGILFRKAYRFYSKFV